MVTQEHNANINNSLIKTSIKFLFNYKFLILFNMNDLFTIAGVATLYNANKYKILQTFQIELGTYKLDERPCLIVVFNNNITNDIIVVVNCHFPHNKTQQDAAFNKIYKLLTTLTFNHIIIGGDFNQIQHNLLVVLNPFQLCGLLNMLISGSRPGTPHRQHSTYQPENANNDRRRYRFHHPPAS
jgi:hypothetical protein